MEPGSDNKYRKVINMEIKRYTQADELLMLDLIRSEGSDWDCYSAPDAFEKYKRVLENSITYVAYQGDILCGYARAIDDFGLYIYICDLLVAKQFRGQELGRKLMEQVCTDHPQQTVYVMSGVDGYYTKLGYSREGSIFEVNVR